MGRGEGDEECKGLYEDIYSKQDRKPTGML